MRFSKIKYDGTKVTLEWAEDGKDEHTHKLVSEDRPETRFVEAQAALGVEVLALLELPEDYGASLSVRGVSLSYGDGGRVGAVVTALKDIEGANAPLVLNTPHLQEEDLDDPNPSLPMEMLRLIQRLTDNAERYVNGHREQGDLFANDETTVELSTEGFTTGPMPMKEFTKRVRERTRELATSTPPR